jgi:hypothetical protein
MREGIFCGLGVSSREATAALTAILESLGKVIECGVLSRVSSDAVVLKERDGSAYLSGSRLASQELQGKVLGHGTVKDT